MLMPKTLQNLEIISMATTAEWDKWLAKNCAKVDAIWLRIFKKDSGEKSITYAEALDCALCHGWIDSKKRPCDSRSWLQRFGPRRSKGLWSKLNRGHAERLIKLGRMQPTGLVEIEKAKREGRWEAAYDSPASATIPEDFIAQLSRNKKALAFFDTLNKTNRYSIAWRLQTAKKQETRQKRAKAIIEMLARGQKFH
jgi:uncharacterized protein YdeI (YjbR/CyaY-like superfamily)